MKLQLQSTSETFVYEREGRSIECRLWTGQTEDGTPVRAYVAAVSPQTHDAARLAAFEQELHSIGQPEVRVFDARFIL